MRDRPLLLFALVTAAAVAAGAATLALSGSPLGSWVRNPAAWVLGALIGAAVGRRTMTDAAALAIQFASVAVLAATFLFNAVDGVHRWIDAGPLHINAAALVLPASIVALTKLRSAAALLFSAAVHAALLAAQPDASQATAYALAAAVVLLSRDAAIPVRYAGAALLGALAMVSWLRPDPLQPVPEVEGILGLALSVSPLLAAVAVLALALTCIAPLALGPRTAAAALTVYFVTVALAPLAGAFPVPLVGLGMSFPVGLLAGFGLLAAIRNSEAAGP